MKKLAILTTLAAAAATTLAGCSSGGGAGAVNNPFKKYTKDEQIAATAARSYKEIKRENVIYVVSSPDAVKRVRAGEEPALKVAAIGFGPNGEKVVFEANKDGLENGLMKEFERRHGLSQS